MSEPRVLVVEDEPDLADGIAEILQDEGYTVTVVNDGVAALERIRAGKLDLIVLDVMLPGLDGFTVCQTARAEGHDEPVLFLTAKGDVEDRVKGLEIGGDDYLPKPFHRAELLLRVKAILRRRLGAPSRVIRFGGNEVNLSALSATGWDGRKHQIPEREAKILAHLWERAGEVVTREEVLGGVWGQEARPASRVVEQLVERLRERFEREPGSPQFLHTIRGVGYRFDTGDR